MNLLKLNPGQVLVKPIPADLNRGCIELVKDTSPDKRGIVLSLGINPPQDVRGLKEGDTVVYRKVVVSTDHGDYVDIAKLLWMELK